MDSVSLILLHVCCTTAGALLFSEPWPDRFLRPHRAARGEPGVPEAASFPRRRLTGRPLDDTREQEYPRFAPRPHP